MEKLFDSIPFLISQNIVLKALTINDLDDIKKMLLCDDVYKYVPTFVPELQCNGNIEFFINTMCKDLFDNKIEIILGIYLRNIHDKLCGLLELYHYDEEEKRVSIGIRLNKEYWNKGISTEAISLIIKYLFNEIDIKTILASNIINNTASGRCLEKNEFIKIEEEIIEDWGYSENVYVDKWILKRKNKRNI